MKPSFIPKVLLCIFFFGFTLYSYVDKQNQVTELKLRLPKIAKEIKSIEEENTRLKYEIEQFENPQHLMELARENAYSHLKYPSLCDVLTLSEGVVLQPENVETRDSSYSTSHYSLAASVK